MMPRTLSALLPEGFVPQSLTIHVLAFSEKNPTSFQPWLE